MNPQAYWMQIIEWYAANAPEAELAMCDGASTSEIEAFERQLGKSVPEEFRICYQLHNGSDGAVFPDGYCLMPLEDCLSSWQMLCELLEDGVFPDPTDIKGPIKHTWWNRDWIPFTHSGGGDHTCLDLDPPIDGKIGQVISFHHEYGPLQVEGASFSDWLRRFSEDLVAGKFVFDCDEQMLCRAAKQ